MHLNVSLVSFGLAATTSAFSLESAVSSIRSTAFDLSVPKAFQRATSCPPIWNDISIYLYNQFIEQEVCNSLARQAIRAAFHDCAAWDLSLGYTGGCDGSLVLSNEGSRRENAGLVEIIAYYKKVQKQKFPSVSVADLIQFGSSVAIVTCPGGPTVKVGVGRKDSSKAAPPNLLPVPVGPQASAPIILALFKAKGFTEKELAALIGAHTTSRQNFVDTNQSNAPQDSTPNKWDVKYYSETLKAVKGVFTFQSDINLATDTSTGVAKEFKSYVGNQKKWTGDFAPAMNKMGLLGVPNPGKLIDCTGSLPKGISSKRDMKTSPINARAI